MPKHQGEKQKPKGSTTKCLLGIVEQQKEMVSLLKTMMGQSSNPVTSVPAATHVQQSSGATHHQQSSGATHHQQSSGATHHQQRAPVTHPRSADTESSIIEDLLELTSDEEFMTSSSWNSILPEYPTLPSLQLSQQATAPVPRLLLQQFTTPVPQLSLQPTPEPQPSQQQFTTTVPHLSQQPSTPVPQPLFQQSVVQPSQQLTLPAPHLPQQSNAPVPQQSSQLTQPLQLTNPAQTSNAGAQSGIQQPPFSTPPKLLPVERVMMDYPGTDEASLRRLMTALAREAIFGRDALCRSSLSGKNKTDSLEKHKLDYIKAVVKSRVPNMPEVTFEGIWSKCRASLSKSCQTLRTTAKKKSSVKHYKNNSCYYNDFCTLYFTNHYDYTINFA